jgi:imidazolonepropionase-like amidohydrolase
MGVGSDRIAEQAELEPESDAALLAAGWATLTPLSGVREDVSEGAATALEAGLAAAADAAATPGRASPGRVD